MDVLTSAADAILSENKISDPGASSGSNSRSVFRDLTNSDVPNSSNSSGSSLDALLNEKIVCPSLSRSKVTVKTPGKRRKNSLKYGDENEAPTPKTPKNDTKFLMFSESPCTPLSNLKMLTRIASMEEHIPSKKSLFETPATLHKPSLGMRRCRSESTTSTLFGSKDKLGKTKLKRHSTSSDLDQNLFKNKSESLVSTSELSRREKSLGLLCERFLEHFPLEVSCLETPRRLVIDDVASTLRTERRRVYDIVNILESLNMASRVQKNMYQWMGKQHLESTFSKLKGLAQDLGIGVHLSSPIDQSLRDLKQNSSTPGIAQADKSDARKDKSIGILCQKFFMLFLTSPSPHVIQLDTAIRLLLGQEGDDLEKLRTRGRRIYDIANVLVALRLIKKLPHCKSFMYIGPQVEATKCREDEHGQQQNRLRHSLLPPPLMVSVPRKNGHFSSKESTFTPSEEDDLDLKTGRTKKPLSHSIKSRAKRNCLITRTKSDDGSKPTSSNIPKHPSLQEMCQAAEVERERLVKCTRSDAGGEAREIKPLQPYVQGGKPVKSYLFSRLGSPRMALTFKNTSQSPPSLTSRPAVPSPTVSRVIVRPPFILHKLDTSQFSSPQGTGLGQAPMFVIRTGTARISALPKAPQTRDLGTHPFSGGFKVYSKRENSLRTLSLPSVTTQRLDPSGTEKKTVGKRSPPRNVLKKAFSTQTALPNVSLNTLSRSHYKTVIGSSSRAPNVSFSAPREGSYRFVINTKPVELQQGSETTMVKTEFPPEKPELRQPAFVRMFQAGNSDDHNTDTELESIFGDAFKFTRPKTMIHKMSPVSRSSN